MARPFRLCFLLPEFIAGAVWSKGESMSNQGRKGVQSFPVMVTNLWGIEEAIIECGGGSYRDSSLLDYGLRKGKWLVHIDAYELTFSVSVVLLLHLENTLFSLNLSSLA